jgi:hypothetical protein
MCEFAHISFGKKVLENRKTTLRQQAKGWFTSYLPVEMVPINNRNRPSSIMPPFWF